MSQKLAAVITSLSFLALLADWLFNSRPLALIGPPMLAAIVMAISSLTLGLKSEPAVRPPHLAGTLEREQNGRFLWLLVAMMILFVTPRLGLPLLSFAIARYRGGGLRLALAMAMLSGIATELLLVRFLSTPLPLMTDHLL